MNICTVLFTLSIYLLAASLVVADESHTPYGEDFLHTGSPKLDAAPALLPTQAEIVGDSNDLSSDYESWIEELERLGGPYEDALAEPLSGLAHVLKARGDLVAAEQVYRRALHLVRINDGLYSERQIPLVREMLDIYRSTGDYETLDERYDYFFRLYGGGRPPYDEIKLRAMVEYLRWQREAHRLGLDPDNRRLAALYELNKEILERVTTQYDIPPQWQWELTLSQVRNLYLLENRIQPEVQLIGVGPSSQYYAQQQRAQPMDFEQQRLMTLHRTVAVRGKEVLQGVIGALSSAAPTLRARAHLELGDWYHWHGAESRASAEYQQVVDLMAGGEDEQLQAWLGEPVELPANGAFERSRSAEVGKAPVNLLANFDVSTRGKVSNIELGPLAEDYTWAAIKLKRDLRRTRFRPRYLDGVAQGARFENRKYEMFER